MAVLEITILGCLGIIVFALVGVGIYLLTRKKKE